MNLLVINGPNINMLGIREKEIYGEKTYDDLVKYIYEICNENNIDVEFFQSNHEGAIIDKIQEAYNKKDAILINPAAYTHTSIAIADALKAVNIPTVEVHLSDVANREPFRKVSYILPVCIKGFSKKGFESYKEGILFLQEYLKKQD